MHDSEPPVGTFITFGPLTLLIREEWFNLKNNILALSPRATIFLRRTSGRGKSSFVYYLIYCILIAGKGSKESQSVVGFVENAGSDGIVKNLLTNRSFIEVS